MESLKAALFQTSMFWLALSVAVSIWGYWVRAKRWKLLIDVSENHVPVTRVFWALMSGYLINMLVPRAGEVARCGILKKSDQVQMGNLLGTVLLERTIDLFFLIFTILLAFIMENEVFLSLIGKLVSLETLKSAAMEYLPILVGAVLLTGILISWIFKKYRDRGLIKKLRHFIRDFLKGLNSLKYVKNQKGFWVYSIVIWIIYFLMMYFVALAIPSTAGLSPASILMVMVMGSIGMIAPVQGGIGTFHALVAFILVIYGLSDEEGKIFAVIIHSTQVIIVMVLGVISLIVLAKFMGKKEPIRSSLR